MSEAPISTFSDEFPRAVVPESGEGRTREVIVRWSAFYETRMKVPKDADYQQVMLEAAELDIDVPGSDYQPDTWDVERITDAETEEEID